MTSNQCPACHARTSPVLLESSSSNAAVNYYRCEHCAHVWTTPKDGVAVLRHVTPLTNSCPACQTLTPPVLMRDARVDYYRCEQCAHVWTTTKDGTSTVRRVTPLKHAPRTLATTPVR